MENVKTGTIVRFPDNTYRASVDAGEYWFDGTYDQCLDWLVSEGVESVSLRNY